MGITTKRGDGGWTDLLFGGRVRKDDPRIEACGALDELNAFLGLARASVRGRTLKRLLLQIQRDLFIVGSEVVVSRRGAAKLEYRVDHERLRRIEEHLSAIESRLRQTECCFIIPGGSPTSALLDVCRCVARRAERRVATMHRRRMLFNPLVLAYLNRLSDLLFLLARSEEKRHMGFVAGP